MPIHVQHDGAVATVTIDTPPVNALSFAAYDEIRHVFSRVASDPAVSVVLLTGAGRRAFAAGHDVREFVGLTPDSADTELVRVQRAFDAVEDCPVPVIAMINGPAIGAGLALASLCDIRIASSEAVFALPEIDVGVLGSGSHLMHIAPQGLTRLLVLSGYRLSAADALRAGMIEAVHAPEDLRAAGERLAADLAAKDPVALRLAKQSFAKLAQLSVREGYAYECTLTSTLRREPSAARSARAFLEKRVG